MTGTTPDLHEREAVSLLAEGIPARDVASRFGLHQSTVFGWRHSSRAELAMRS